MAGFSGLIRACSWGWEAIKAGNMNPVVAPVPAVGKKKKLLDQMRDVMRLKHYSIRTERSYCDWVERFIRYHGMRHPHEMREAEVTEFLTHLAREGQVAASTQNQALSALLFLYKEVLKEEIGWLGNVERASKPPRLPVVLTRDEVGWLLLSCTAHRGSWRAFSMAADCGSRNACGFGLRMSILVMRESPSAMEREQRTG